jgi:hypothetical protein
MGSLSNTNKVDAIENLSVTLNKSRGMMCTNIIAGMGVGTAVHLDFGQLLNSKNIKTSRRSYTVEMYEISIFIECATWRLEDSKSVICSTASTDNRPESALMVGLNRLLQQRLIDGKLWNTAHDLILKFENGLTLCVFSVPMASDLDNNYTVFDQENIFEVGFDATIKVIPRGT